MATFTDSASLFAAINKEMRAAMEEVDTKGLEKAKKNAQSYYPTSSPEYYEQTGHYGDSPDSKGVMGGGNHVSVEIYMNPAGHGYRTGTFSAQQVWNAVEDHNYGVTGKSGIWAQTESNVEQIAIQAFSKRFNG